MQNIWFPQYLAKNHNSAQKYFAKAVQNSLAIADHVNFFGDINSMSIEDMMRLKWENLYPLADGVPTKWGFVWNIYTAFVLNQRLDGDKRLEWILETHLGEYITTNMNIFNENIYGVQERLMAMLCASFDDDAIVLYPVESSWEVTTPHSMEGFHVKRWYQNNFINAYKFSCHLLKQCIAQYLLSTLAAIKHQSGYIFHDGSQMHASDVEIHYLKTIGKYKCRDPPRMTGSFKTLLNKKIDYECNYLLPVYGIEL